MGLTLRLSSLSSSAILLPWTTDPPLLPRQTLLEIAIVIVAILILSGLFSGSEAALVSLSDAEMEAMVHEKRMGSVLLSRVHRNIERSVITIVVCNNVVNIVGSIVVGQLVIGLYGDAVLAVITTGLTFGIIVFSEIIPKSLGIHYAEHASLLAAPVILLLTIILLPLIVILEWVTNLLKSGERKVGTEQQIRSLVTIGRKSGHIESDEGQLIHRAFILNDKEASDIMTPLKDIIGLNEDDTIKDVWEKIDHEAYSRYPVFGASIHEVQATVFKQDVLQALLEKRGGESIQTIYRDALVVIDAMTSDELIALFREKSKHLAVVQNDGHTVGLVTLEDVLEELVGDIEDETDVED